MKTVSEKDQQPCTIAGVGSSYFRPKTRGELAYKIKEGVPCEVVTMNRQFKFTSITNQLAPAKELPKWAYTKPLEASAGRRNLIVYVISGAAGKKRKEK